MSKREYYDFVKVTWIDGVCHTSRDKEKEKDFNRRVYQRVKKNGKNNPKLSMFRWMADSQRDDFFRPYRGELLPEVCSHGLEHVMLCYEDDGSYSYLSPWVTIQEGRYRYCVSPNGNIVKFVIAEFLAVEVNIEI